MGETCQKPPFYRLGILPFSILERIDVGETALLALAQRTRDLPFSILERIDVGETTPRCLSILQSWPFSILERIDVGETRRRANEAPLLLCFQYPRTDRRG